MGNRWRKWNAGKRPAATSSEKLFQTLEHTSWLHLLLALKGSALRKAGLFTLRRRKTPALTTQGMAAAGKRSRFTALKESSWKSAVSATAIPALNALRKSAVQVRFH